MKTALKHLMPVVTTVSVVFTIKYLSLKVLKVLGATEKISHNNKKKVYFRVMLVVGRAIVKKKLWIV